MGRVSVWCARHRLAVALPLAAALTLIAAPVSADPQQDVNGAQQALKNAQQQAGGADRQLASARSALASATAHLVALQRQITSLDAAIVSDQATVRELNAQLLTDRTHLAAYLRESYESGGSEAMLAFVISAKDIATAIQREVQIGEIASASQQLVTRINSEDALAAATLVKANNARAQLGAAEEQAKTAQAIVAVEEEQFQVADVAAHAQLSQAKQQLTAAEAALAAAKAAGVIYSPIPGSQFTIDTDLRLPSGETAAGLDQFLQGTALAGLGASFVHAEQTYHVSARYFLAHAILESGWGTSAIAQNKHNLFGFNANDSNPYGDATTFASFDACIQYVAQFVAVNYLTPGGGFFHGPTLRGMNVDYASDPNWASKIASIAQTIP